ncbi:MAG TPA: type I-C CRISPR-associated protein Cas8c/Csd1 [Tissierellia bacterium]|nr:type I-C CRISPR-associated protein Cas8c/Csd1 [Tissierellia bacterium]
MIIHALKEYYDRKVLDPNSGIAPEGFELKELQFVIVIDESGCLVSIDDLREKRGNRLVGKTYLLPQSKGRSGSKSYETVFFLWDHLGYVLGLPEDDKKSALQHQAWIDQLNNLPEQLTNDVAIRAMKAFYESDEVKKAKTHPMIEECLKSQTRNVTFRLVGDVPVPCRPAVQKFIEERLERDVEGASDDVRHCMITGRKGTVSRIHSQTPIGKDSKVLVGFQKNSGYDSYGKEQGFNAPMIASTEFAYTTALNTLLRSQDQKMVIGDTTFLFWSKKPSTLETSMLSMFGEPPRDNPDAYTNEIKSLILSAQSGAYVERNNDNRFYVLGLSPNVARISVRYWYDGTVDEVKERISDYFRDFEIVKPEWEMKYYSIWRVLVNVSVQDKSENIPPRLVGDLIRSVFEGTVYPAGLLNAAIRRIRSDTDNRVKPVRAAAIKAYLNRYYRFNPNANFKEVSMALDVNQPSIGYQLGRLFSTLERIQEDANPGLNATIRERYYGAASSSPITVFPNLLKLKVHHIAKLRQQQMGKAVNYEKILSEIIGKVDQFPSHLMLHDQGMFALGYYHQQQRFFTKRQDPEVQDEEK